MPPPRFLLVGHSHSVCIDEALRSANPPGRHGYARLSAEAAQHAPFWATAAILARTIPETLARARAARRLILPPLRRSQREAASARLVREAVSAELARMIGAEGAIASSRIPAALAQHDITVLASIGGSEHNIFAMVDFDIPFDFVLPAREDLGADPTRDLVPYMLVREVLERQINRFLRMIAVLHDIAGDRVFVLESPPPVGDDAEIVRTAKRYHPSGSSDGWTIPSPAFRHKIWRVSSEIYSDFCRREGLTFVEAPAAAVENGMFMRREGWRRDAVHGNAWYGARTIEGVTARLASTTRITG